ncbi:MAG: lipid A deacylase LpxR family protein [Alphaproteobacteria bacterium]|nr:lipid A deacylase LpxR family protein [Alphaproteobacteria bacterium]
MTSRRLWAAAGLALLAAPVAAADPDGPPLTNPWLAGSVTVITENDKWAMRGDDRHYTNGVRFGWVSDVIDRESPWRWALGLAGAIPSFDPNGETRIGFAFGQSMYTPGNTRKSAPIFNDRPYAGWLYGGIALVNETRNGTRGIDAADKLDTLEINVGVVGPGAGGRKAQNDWHHFIGVDEASGWSNQLPNEPGVVVYYERKWRDAIDLRTQLVDGLAIDLIPHAAVSLGNVATYAAGGGSVRFGRNLDVDFGPPRIRPALSGSGYVRGSDDLGWYLFAGAEARAVAYDIFLDGPMFRSSQSVDRRPLVLDFQAGAAVTWRSLRVAYTYVVRTREFASQSTPDRFGAISLTLGF